MNMTTFTTYREPQIERFPRLSGFSVEVSVTPEHFSFMKSLHPGHRLICNGSTQLFFGKIFFQCRKRCIKPPSGMGKASGYNNGIF